MLSWADSERLNMSMLLIVIPRDEEIMQVVLIGVIGVIPNSQNINHIGLEFKVPNAAKQVSIP